jgi:DNA ligase-1
MKAPGDSVRIEDVQFPTFASYKLDGYRASHHGVSVVSKSLKPFRNDYTTTLFKSPQLKGLDGELVVGPPYGEDVIRRTNSGLTSREGAPAVTWWVFDDFTEPTLPFDMRFSAARARVRSLKLSHVKVLQHKYVEDATELLELEAAALEKGYEGLMLRSPDGPYKFGRSTPKEGHLFKFKRFLDAEAVVIAVEEGNVNGNELSDTGKRRTLKANMRPSGMIGTLLCMDLKTGREVRVAPGRLTHEERKLPCTFLGAVITYRYFPTGTIDAPRFPTFQTFRDRSDL